MRKVNWINLLAILGIAFSGFGSQRSYALTDEEIFREFRFNFINPGGRSLGMGGAYIAAADDATAAWSNPAALNYIFSPEYFVEFRSLSPESTLSSGQIGDRRIPNEDLPFLSLDSVTNPEDISNVSFASFAWPFNIGSGLKSKRMTVAFSRQVVLDQEVSLAEGANQTEAQVSLNGFPPDEENGQLVVYAVDTEITGQALTEIVYWNAGASLALHRDFSVGITLSLAQLDANGLTVRTVTDPLGLVEDPANPRDPNTPATDINQTFFDDDDSDFSYSIGIHWHPDSIFPTGESPIKFGAVFRKGAEFAITEETTVNNNVSSFKNDIIVPDRYGIGVSYKTLNKPFFVISAEAERIQFSDMLEGFRTGENFLTGPGIAGQAITTTTDPVLFDVDDENLFRFGVEYAFRVKRVNLSLLAGYFNTPDSKIRMTQFNSTDPDENAAFLQAFSGGEDVDHVTTGFTLGIGNSMIQAGFDFSDAGDQAVVSYIYRARARR